MSNTGLKSKQLECLFGFHTYNELQYGYQECKYCLHIKFMDYNTYNVWRVMYGIKTFKSRDITMGLTS